MTALELRAGTTGAVATRLDEIGDHEVVMIEIGPSAKLGALSLADGEKMAEGVSTALEHDAPLVCILASTGSLIGDGIAASHGWGLAARHLVRASGVVPVVFAVHGAAVSGMALMLGLADQVVMTADAYAFVTGPHIVRQVTGEAISAEGLGGSAAHSRHSGVASAVVDNLDAAIEWIGDLLRYLPSHVDELPPPIPTGDPIDRLVPEAADILPDSTAGSYDIRDVIGAIIDDREFLELREAWAPNLVTGLATLGGTPVGILANQPLSIAGTLDIPASQKGAGFVTFCDAFNLPIVTIIDTPGFYPGKDLEWRGMIRHGAQLAFAYARATVPRINLTLRKSYGGAYIVMDSKFMGNDLALAWPTAEIAVMGAKGAIEILNRRDKPDDDERARLEADYEERLLNPYIAAQRGSVDRIIDPADTRRELIAAVRGLDTKREHLAPRAHDNTPL